MARRRIGQERLRFDDVTSRATGSLDEIARLIDWADIDRSLFRFTRPRRASRLGTPLSLFKALLLAIWHDLSDVKLADSITDRSSSRRFCGFALNEPTPEAKAFVRFRQELVARSLDRVLSEAVRTSSMPKAW
jgi:IS5 family transposase